MSAPDLDPEVQEFVNQMTAAWRQHPPLSEMTMDQARQVAEIVREPWRSGGPVMARVSENFFETPTGPMRFRVHHPEPPHRAPALIYLHGGGFTFFSIDTHDRLMREYASAGGFAVIGLDYALAPEHKYPAAFDQVVAFVRWLEANGSGLGIDPSRLAIGGDSAGGNLSLATALRLRDEGEQDRIKAILLNYGGFQPGCSDEAEARFGGPNGVLNRAEADYFWGNYLRGPEDERDPYACPLLADLHDLPPVFLTIPDCDLIAEQSFALAGRLRESGNQVEERVYPGTTHSFLEAMSISRAAREAIGDGSDWLRRKLQD